MKLIVSGLGKMGMQIAEMLSSGGHQVVAHNRSPEKVDIASKFGAIKAYSPQEAIDNFSGEPVILWLMLPAGVIDDKIHEWLEVLPSGSVIIDGGNSDYRGDPARYDAAKAKGCSLLDIGTSGGVWGKVNGFSMMVGGDKQSYELVTPLLDCLAEPRGGHAYFAGAGSGHYVKMVHNAIEYGMMESLAEGYRVLKEGPYKNLDLGAAAKVWQRSSVITSWLNSLCEDIFNSNPSLEDIPGVVAESGEARWTLETAKDHSIDMPSIQAAFDVRLASQRGNTDFRTKLLAAMRNQFGGHDIGGK